MFYSNTKSISAGNTFTDSMDCKSGSLALSISGQWLPNEIENGNAWEHLKQRYA